MGKFIRKAMIIFLLCICLVIGLNVVSTVTIVAADTPLDVSVTVGFDKDNSKFYKIGYLAPVLIEIDNKLKDISGEVQIEITNENNNITLYSQLVNVPVNTTKKLVLNVPMLKFTNTLNINIVQDGKTLYKKTARIANGASSETLVIGFLSDDYESIRYIDKITAPNYSNSTSTVELDENSFPEETEVLKMFDVMIINNYDTSKLGDKQYSALKSWVLDGGTLIIGTGPYGAKTLNIFKDDFVAGTTEDTAKISTSSLYDYETKSMNADPLQLDILKLNINEGETILKEGDIILGSKIKKGAGAIGIFAFDFGLKPITVWVGNRDFSTNVMDKLISSEVKTRWGNKGKLEGDYNMLQYALRNAPELTVPKSSTIIFLFILYILIAAPINYLVLKRLDKRELMWLTIPALSVIFAGIIYFVGFGTRLNEPIANIISIAKIDENGGVDHKVYAGIFNPTKRDLIIEPEEGMNFKPVAFSNFYNDRNSDPQSTKVDSKVLLGAKTGIEFYKTGLWSMNTVVAEMEEPIKGKLHTSLKYAKDKITGTITNNTNYDLDELYLVSANQLGIIGEIKRGEAKTIDLSMKNFYGNRYDMLNLIYKDPNSTQAYNNPSKLKDAELMEYRENQQKRQVMEMFLNQSGGSGDSLLIGWSNTPISKKIFVNSKEVKKLEKTLVLSNTHLNFANGNKIEYPLGYIRPELMNNSSGKNGFDENRNMIYGNGTFEMNFKIDKTVSVEELSIRFTVPAGKVKQYIWDVKMASWTEGQYANMDIIKGDIEKYISSDNVLKFRFDIDDNEMQIPQIGVKGSVK